MSAEIVVEGMMGHAVEEKRTLTRRQLLSRGAMLTGAAALGVLLAACGTQGGTATTSSSGGAATGGQAAGTPGMFTREASITL